MICSRWCKNMITNFCAVYIHLVIANRSHKKSSLRRFLVEFNRSSKPWILHLISSFSRIIRLTSTNPLGCPIILREQTSAPIGNIARSRYVPTLILNCYIPIVGAVGLQLISTKFNKLHVVRCYPISIPNISFVLF